MNKEKQILTERFRRAKKYLKEGDRDKARDECDLGLVNIVNMRENGLKDGESIEGQPMDLWIQRFWVFLEKHNLLLGQE